MSGGGAEATNVIGTDTLAYVIGSNLTSDGDDRFDVLTQNLVISAADHSTITADSGAAAVAASVAAINASLSWGAAVADNKINNRIKAFIRGARVGAGKVLVSANEAATIMAKTATSSEAGSIFGGAAAGAVTDATNTSTSSVEAFLDATHVESAGSVAVAASSNSTLDAAVAAVAVSGSVLSLAVGVSLAENTIGDDVSAFVQDSSVTANGGDISVTATSDPEITTTNIVGAASFGTSGSGAGGNSQTTIHGTTEAYVGGTTQVTADSLSISAHHETTAKPVIVVASGSGVTAASDQATTTNRHTTQALVDLAADLTFSGGTINVRAESESTVGGIAGGAAAVGFMNPRAAVDNRNSAALGSNTTIFARVNFTLRATSISNSGGDIRSNAVAQIISNGQQLEAGIRGVRLIAAGSIGTPGSPIQTDSSLLTADAGGDVFVTEYTGNLELGTVSSSQGRVELVSAGAIVDGLADGNAHVTTTAGTIALTAQSGAIGLPAAPILVASPGLGATVSATAQSDIHLTETAGDLEVGRIISTAGNIRLAVAGAGSGENLTLGMTAVVAASAGTIELLAGDDITTSSGSVISADGPVAITAAYLDNNPLVGVAVNLAGDIVASAVSIETGAGPDEVNIVDAGDGSNRLILDDSGDPMSNSGRLTSSKLTGFGSAGVEDSGIDHMEIALGSGHDALTIDSTSATVSVIGPAEAGSLSYHPEIGTILDIGVHSLTVTAAATDNYNEAALSVELTVLKAYSISGLVYVDFNNDGEVNFGERPPADGTIDPGQTAGIGFWQNRNGQALIQSLNGSSASTQLGDWLAATLPNMFGQLSGKTNTDVGAHFRTLFAIRGQKLGDQVMATALAVYVTNESLAGTTAQQYGFTVTTHGVGNRTYNVGTSGAAFDVEDHTEMTVLDLLLATDAMTIDGVLYDSANTSLRKSLRNMANKVYGDIND